MPSTISCTHNFDFNHVIFDSAHVASLATAFAGIPETITGLSRMAEKR